MTPYLGTDLMLARLVETTLTIGQLAKQVGVTVEAVRFYERRGLLERPRKPFRGFRRYPPESIARLAFVRRAAAIGFTLREIAELLSLRAKPSAPCAGVRTRALAKVADIDRRVAELQRIRAAVSCLVAACQGDRAVSTCSILGALAGDAPETPSLPGDESCPTPRRPKRKTAASPASKRASAASRTA